MKKGIIIFAILSIIIGLINGFLGFVYVVQMIGDWFISLSFIENIVTTILFFLLFVTGIGLFLLKDIFRKTIIVLAILNIIRIIYFAYIYLKLNAFPTLKGDLFLFFGPMSIILLLIFYSLIIWYFRKNEIKEIFQKKEQNFNKYDTN